MEIEYNGEYAFEEKESDAYVSKKNMTESKNSAIVTSNTYYDEEGQISFKRLNFDDPTSILKYGQDILQKSKDMVNKLSILANIEEENPIKFDNMINKLSENFGELSISKMDSAPKALPEKGIFSPIGKLINRVNEKKYENKTYSESYQLEEYNKNIDKLAAEVEKKKNNTLNAINLDREIGKKMSPFINALSLAIELGNKDLDEYIKTFYEQKKQEYQQNMSEEIQKEILIAEQKIILAKRKLNELGKQLILMKNDRDERKLRQGPNFELVIGYDSYLTTTVDALRRQAQSIIANKRLKSNQEKLQLLNDKSNEVFQKNSEILVENIQKSLEISTKGTIYNETIQNLGENVKAGIDLLRKGNKQLSEQIEQDKKFVNGVLSSFEEYEQELKDIYNNSSMNTSAFSSKEYIDEDDEKGNLFFPFKRK